jgi:hypothetical protein
MPDAVYIAFVHKNHYENSGLKSSIKAKAMNGANAVIAL